MSNSMVNDIVLVVDDSPDTLSFVNDALEAAGMDVLVALEGKQAITITQRIKPDIILMDALMPNMDGFETCKALKEDPSLASIPVIFMTGLTDTCDVVKGLEAGGVDYLTKPIQPNELLARMKVHLTNARTSASVQEALDTSGQYLMTVNRAGDLLWGTPQAHALMAKAGINALWFIEHFPVQSRNWLVDLNEAEKNPLKLNQLKYPLELQLVSAQDNGELLVRLIDGDRPKGPELLKVKLQMTERESEVLHWVANGKTNREIAEILSMSPRTVNKHLEQIFPKLGVENRTAAAGVALRVLSKE